MVDATGAQDPLRAWRDFVASPWGRVRYAVAARAVDEALARESGVPGQVVAGGLDDLAAEAPVPGRFDLVLAHFLLHYRPDTPADLALLAGRLVPGGLLSVALPAPASAVLRATLQDGPRAGLVELDRACLRTVTFDADVRKIDPEELAGWMAAAGVPVWRRYGGRVVTDLLPNEPKHDPDWFADLLELELRLCDTEPFHRLGQFVLLLGKHTAGGMVERMSREGPGPEGVSGR